MKFQEKNQFLLLKIYLGLKKKNPIGTSTTPTENTDSVQTNGLSGFGEVSSNPLSFDNVNKNATIKQAPSTTKQPTRTDMPIFNGFDDSSLKKLNKSETQQKIDFDKQNKQVLDK